MRFTSAAILAFASVVFAQTDGFDAISQPAEHSTLDAGEPFVIVWEPTDAYPGTVTITLIGGPEQKFQNDIDVVAKSIENSLGTYKWTVGADLGDFAVYGLRINLDSDDTIFQYSFPFQIKPASGSSNSSSTATGSASATDGSSYGTGSATVTTSYKTSHTSATYTPGTNYTTTGGPSQTDVTVTNTPSATTSNSPTTIPSNPAGTVAASSFALVGGLAMAIFAL